MDQIWENYLQQVFDIDQIDNLVVYTDHFRFWLTQGLLDLADRLDWKRSLQILEEITDEEGMEVRQSMGVLSDTTLLVIVFSEHNPIIEELSGIFPLLQSPTGFRGYSLITHQNLPDQFFLTHLNADLYDAKDLEMELRQHLRRSLTFQNEVSFFEAEITSVASFPYMEDQHVILPATELVAELELTSLNGTIVLDRVIGAVIECEELVDPFGRLDKSVSLLIEKGQIIDIRGDDLISSRITTLFPLPTEFNQVQVTIGLGPKDDLSGFIEHDRLLSHNLTVSWFDANKGAHFEGILGHYTLSSEIDR